MRENATTTAPASMAFEAQPLVRIKKGTAAAKALAAWFEGRAGPPQVAGRSGGDRAAD